MTTAEVVAQPLRPSSFLEASHAEDAPQDCRQELGRVAQDHEADDPGQQSAAAAVAQHTAEDAADQVAQEVAAGADVAGFGIAVVAARNGIAARLLIARNAKSAGKAE